MRGGGRPRARGSSREKEEPTTPGVPVRRGERRSLSHVGGAVDVGGDPRLSKLLAEALDVQVSVATKGEGPDRAHVHGFHAYPARMHPVTAARLVRTLSPANALVLDPFCGSGTVLVEAMIAGRRSVGTDLNPLAVALAKLKTTGLDEAARRRVVGAARIVAALADERRKARAGATQRYPKEDVEVFEPHVLLELDSLRAGITRTPDEKTRRALFLVLSAILVKVSRKHGDTSEAVGPRRISAGYTGKLFVKKAEELCLRLADLARILPRGATDARVEIDDATRLSTVGPGSVDLVVTSPPYVGTYDYVAHHALRMRWLGFDATAFEGGEIGARRRYAPSPAFNPGLAWSKELSAFLSAARKVMKPGAPIVLLMADSAVGRQALRADVIVPAVAQETGFRSVARASQQRPHFHGATAAVFRSAPRAEHALLLERT